MTRENEGEEDARWRPTRAERRALGRLGWFTCALAAVPYATYKITRRTVCPAAYEAYGAAFLATESGRATCAGLFAVISVNVVLLAYVAAALRYGEDEEGETREKKEK